MWETLKEFFRDNMQSCFYKSNFGIECPGCGIQRAIFLLMEGDVVGSFKMYPALIPLLITLMLLILHLIFRFRKGAEILKYLFIGTAVLMFLNYIYKIL